MSTSDGNAVLVNVLSSSLRSTLNGLETAPGLIRRVLEEESWRRFTTPRGEQAEHDTFESFVTTPPTAGLGKTLEEIVRVVGDDEGALDLLAQTLGVTAEDLRKSGRPQVGIDPIERDAREFGAFAKTGGWIFALKVARSVQPGKGEGGYRAKQDRSDRSDRDGQNDLGKVSAKRFATMGGTSADRVMRFYRAWERAAEAGIVPPFDELTPGRDIELPAADDWGLYYTTRSSGASERGVLISAAAEAEGISPTKALEVAENPTALRAAILADPKTAEAARKALMYRLEDDPELQAVMARTVAETPQLKKAVAAEAKMTDQIDYVRKVAEQGKIKTPAGQTIDAPENVKTEAERHLAMVEHMEGADPTEAAAEAYQAVQHLIAECIEADPEIQVQERRAKFYGRVQKAAKAFADLDPDDAADDYEDDLVETLEKLQETVTACLANAKKVRRPLRSVGGA